MLNLMLLQKIFHQNLLTNIHNPDYFQVRGRELFPHKICRLSTSETQKRGHLGLSMAISKHGLRIYTIWNLMSSILVHMQIDVPMPPLWFEAGPTLSWKCHQEIISSVHITYISNVSRGVRYEVKQKASNGKNKIAS